MVNARAMAREVRDVVAVCSSAGDGRPSWAKGASVAPSVSL